MLSMNCVCGMQRRVRMIEYIRVVSKQRPAKRAFDMQVGAHLRVYIAGKITGDKNYRDKFAKADKETKMGIIADIKQELRRAYALKITYAATQRTSY